MVQTAFNCYPHNIQYHLPREQKVLFDQKTKDRQKNAMAMRNLSIGISNHQSSSLSGPNLKLLTLDRLPLHTQGTNNGKRRHGDGDIEGACNSAIVSF